MVMRTRDKGLGTRDEERGETGDRPDYGAPLSPVPSPQSLVPQESVSRILRILRPLHHAVDLRLRNRTEEVLRRNRRRVRVVLLHTIDVEVRTRPHDVVPALELAGELALTLVHDEVQRDLARSDVVIRLVGRARRTTTNHVDEPGSIRRIAHA